MSLYARLAEEKLRALVGKFRVFGQETKQKISIDVEHYSGHPDTRCREKDCTFNVSLFEIELMPPDESGTIKLSLGMEIYTPTNEECPKECDFDHVCYPEIVIYLDEYGRIRNVKLLDPGC